MNHVHPAFSRRRFVQSMACGSLLLPGVISELLAAESAKPAPAFADPLAAKLSHYAPRAKRVIYLFMTGGVSHLESFDPKPRLAADAGKKYKDRTLLAPQFNFTRAGRSGIPISDLFPNIATCMDDLAVIRSMTGSHFEHFQATLGVPTGCLTV